MDGFSVAMSAFISLIYLVYRRLISDFDSSDIIAPESLDFVDCDPVGASLYLDSDDTRLGLHISLFSLFKCLAFSHLKSLFYLKLCEFISTCRGSLDKWLELSVGRMSVINSLDKHLLIQLRID